MTSSESPLVLFFDTVDRHEVDFPSVVSEFFALVKEPAVIDAVRRFAGKYPIRTLLICGIGIWVLAVGIGINTKFLAEHDLIPDQILGLLYLVGILQLLMMLIGLFMVSMSVLMAVRRLSNPKKAGPTCETSASRGHDEEIG